MLADHLFFTLEKKTVGPMLLATKLAKVVWLCFVGFYALNQKIGQSDGKQNCVQAVEKFVQSMPAIKLCVCGIYKTVKNWSKLSFK